MTWTILEPRDPLLVRDGRPFLPGTDGAHSLDFVPPSVTAGALRTRIWHAKGGWSPEQAKALKVEGPLLAELELGRDELKTLWLPAPKDCVLYPPKETSERDLLRFGLQAGAPFANGDSSLPTHLSPVVPVCGRLPKEKPTKSPPPYWSAANLRAWLSAPPPKLDRLSLDDTQSRNGLIHEPRIHVGLERDGRRTAEKGKLFQSDGLRFAERVVSFGREGESATYRRLALLVRCTHPELKPGILTLGGERRLTLMGTLDTDPRWPAPPMLGTLARVVLLTPAIFREGSVPTQIHGARVVAAAVGRPQTISGWDMAWRKHGGPKPTRRMSPAGSVYWVDLSGIKPEGWVKKVHFSSVSSTEQDNSDGFGLAVVGVGA